MGVCVFLTGLVPNGALPDVDMPDVDRDEPVAEVVVTAQRRPQPIMLHVGNIERLGLAEIERVQHQHIHELLNRVASVWVVRGSGQEHQTAIRSPVLSGGGSCGGLLLAEDGIPVRPGGFCNGHQFIEVISEQAYSIEVIRGPGDASFGSNALHGIVNTLMPMPGKAGPARLSVEAGANNFYRVRGSSPFELDDTWHASFVYANDGGFRDQSGYQQGKMHLKHKRPLLDGEVTIGFSATRLDQESAGFIMGEGAYRDPTLRLTNLNPEAFRDAGSQRLYGIWTRSVAGVDIDVRPYLRHTDMEFSHHALPGKPLEENGHVSGGVISAFTFNAARYRIVAGLDIEWSDVFLMQTQFEPTTGNARTRATRPQGKHYDYEVRGISVAVFAQSHYQVTERLALGAGLRLEYMHYDYDNHMLAGNTRDDGTACGFGGCLYTRPADRSDTNTNLAPKFSVGYRLDAQTSLFASLARGFRVPQMIELYRLQNGQQVSDLDSEHIDSLELGIRNQGNTWSSDIVVYTMRKRDSAFRDADGFNVSGARSDHRGVEVSVDWQPHRAWWLAVDATYARHRYDFDASGPGEKFVSGNDMDTAPRWLGSIELQYRPGARLNLGLQWTSVGKYYLDPGNRHIYPGHSLLHLRGSLLLTPRVELGLRLNNVGNEMIADRADFAGNNYRYLPGRGRELFVELRYFPKRKKGSDPIN